MGILPNMIANAIREKANNKWLEERYKNDPSRGFHDLDPHNDYDTANNACYLQSAIKSLGSGIHRLKIVVPSESTLPRGWYEIFDDYALVNSEKELFGTFSLSDLKYLGLELGDYVNVKRKKDGNEYVLLVFSNSDFSKALQEDNCELIEFNLPSKSMSNNSDHAAFDIPKIAMIPTSKNSKAKPHIGIYDDQNLIFEVTASMGAHKVLLNIVNKPVKAIQFTKLDSLVNNDCYYAVELIIERI